MQILSVNCCWIYYPVVPGEPSNIRSLCTVVVWGEPGRPNGVIRGYDLMFRRIETSRVGPIIPKPVTDLYHVVEDSGLPTGSEDLEFQVIIIFTKDTSRFIISALEECYLISLHCSVVIISYCR